MRNKRPRAALLRVAASYDRIAELAARAEEEGPQGDRLADNALGSCAATCDLATDDGRLQHRR
jgi:hypothetical protein